MNAVEIAGALGRDPAEISKRLTNALATLRKLGLVDFEIQALQAQGENEAGAGHLDAAQRILHEAAAIATERGLKNHLRLLNVAAANVALLQNDTKQPGKSLETPCADGAPDVHIAFGRVLAAASATSIVRSSTSNRHWLGCRRLVPWHWLLRSMKPTASCLPTQALARNRAQTLSRGRYIRGGRFAGRGSAGSAMSSGAFPAALASVHNVTVRVECAVEQARMASERQDPKKCWTR